MSEPRKRGIKPGGPNPGGFKRGDDPRRPQGLVTNDGETFAKKARELGASVLDWWHTIYLDEKQPIATRLRASENIVERGFGKATTTLDINVNDNREIRQRTTKELEAMLLQFNEPDEDDVIEASFTTVDTTETQQ